MLRKSRALVSRVSASLAQRSPASGAATGSAALPLIENISSGTGLRREGLVALAGRLPGESRRDLSTTASSLQQAAPATPAPVDAAGSSSNKDPVDPNKKTDGAGWRLTEWLVDHPKIFLAILLSILGTWLVRSNVEDSREDALVRQLESESPLASREIAALSRENRLPLHVFAALSKLLLEEGSPASGGKGRSVDGKDVLAVLRDLLQVQRFYEALRSEVEKPGSFAESLKAAKSKDAAARASSSNGKFKPSPALEAAVASVALELHSLLVREREEAALSSASPASPAGQAAGPSGALPAGLPSLPHVQAAIVPPLASASLPPASPVTKEEVTAAAKRILSALADIPASDDSSPLPLFVATLASPSSSSVSSARLLLKARKQGIVGAYVLERAAFLLAKAYPPDGCASSSAPSSPSTLFAPLSLLHTAELQRRAKEEEKEPIPLLSDEEKKEKKKEELEKGKPAGAWTHDTFLEHSLNPTHYAYEPVKEHELHRPKIALVMPQPSTGGGGASFPLHPLLAVSALGILMGAKEEDLPVIKTSEQKKKEEEEEAEKKKKEEEEKKKKEGQGEGKEKAPVASPASAPASSVPPPPTPRSSNGPFPTASQRLALYLSALRQYKHQVRERKETKADAASTATTGDSASTAVVAKKLASGLASAPINGTLSLPTEQEAEEEDIYRSTFTAEEVCDLIDLLAATYQIPPRFRVYAPSGFFTSRRWPLPKQSIKPSPYHLINSLAFELQMHKAKENPVTILKEGEESSNKTEAGGPRRLPPAPASIEAQEAEDESFFPWRTWKTKAALQQQRSRPSLLAAGSSSTASSPSETRIRAVHEALSLSPDLPDEDILLPNLSRELTFDEVRRIMFSRGICAWGECLVSWHQGHRFSNKWFQ